MRSVRRERMVFASEDWNSANEEVVASLENVLWYPASAPGSQNHNSKSYLALGSLGEAYIPDTPKYELLASRLAIYLYQ